MRKLITLFVLSKRFILFTIGLVTLLIFISCASSKSMNLRLQAGEKSNNGNAVVVRIHQLRNDVNFKRLTIQSYLKDPRNSIGEDQIGEPLEYTIHPADSLALGKIKISKESRFIAITANFFGAEGEKWRLIEPVENLTGKEITIQTTENELTFSSM